MTLERVRTPERVRMPERVRTLEQVRQVRRDRPWLFHSSFNSRVDFCLWTLQVDGLRVPPFDHHADGSHLLRAAGLTAPEWLSWFARVTALQQGGSAARQGPWQVPTTFDPAAVWLGEPAVGTWLSELWRAYPAFLPRRRAFERPLTVLAPYQGLSEVLEAYQERLETLYIHLVSYPTVVVSPILPQALVVGVPVCHLSRSAFRQAIVRGAARLARDAQQRRR